MSCVYIYNSHFYVKVQVSLGGTMLHFVQKGARFKPSPSFLSFGQTSKF